jgi:hypothetical protein
MNALTKTDALPILDFVANFQIAIRKLGDLYQSLILLGWSRRLRGLGGLLLASFAFEKHEVVVTSFHKWNWTIEAR